MNVKYTQLSLHFLSSFRIHMSFATNPAVIQTYNLANKKIAVCFQKWKLLATQQTLSTKSSPRWKRGTLREAFLSSQKWRNEQLWPPGVVLNGLDGTKWLREWWFWLWSTHASTPSLKGRRHGESNCCEDVGTSYSSTSFLPITSCKIWATVIIFLLQTTC